MIWKTVLNVKTFMGKCKQDKISAYAAQTAFFTILSVIPFLMVFSSLIQYTPITKGNMLMVVAKVMPEYVSPFLISLIDEVYNRSVGLISVTAVAAVWSAGRGVRYITDGLNAVNGLEETRGWFVTRFWAAVYTVVFIIAIVCTLLILVFGQSLHRLAVKYVPLLGEAAGFLANFGGFFIFGILILMFDVIFAALPNKKLSFRGQLPGAAICAVAWYVFSMGLSVYVNYFNGFSMYGSLTTIALIMLWLYFCMYIMLMSAEVNVVFGEYFEKLRR